MLTEIEYNPKISHEHEQALDDINLIINCHIALWENKFVGKLRVLKLTASENTDSIVLAEYFCSDLNVSAKCGWFKSGTKALTIHL